MLGLAILFGLCIWLLLTLLAMVLGYKLGRRLTKKKWGRLFGMFTGFMLLMGGWITHWVVEYWQTKAYAASVCGLAGYKIYVPPEEWKKTVSEEEWKQMAEFKSWLVRPSQRNGPKTLVFEGEEYKIDSQIDNRLTSYERTIRKGYTMVWEDLIYDVKRKEVLFKAIHTHTGTGSGWESLEELKFWIDSIPNCESKMDEGDLLHLYKDQTS